MISLNGFLGYIKKYILIVFVLFLSSLLGDCSGEDNITIISIYTVTFDSQQSGLSVDFQHVNKGSKAIKPADPIREGFQFLSWVNSIGEEYDFDSSITNHLTLYAKWDIITTVTFNSVGGSPVESQVYVGMSKATEPPDPTRSDYDFLAWTNSSGEEYDFDTIVTEDIVLGAQWIRLYTITFNPRGGSSVTPQIVREGSNVIKPTDPIRSGYSFSNWTYLGGSVYNFTNTPVTDNLNLYGSWAVLPGYTNYSLTINYNDKVTLDLVIPVIADETFSGQNLLDPKHPDSAYDFYGWYTTAAAEEGDEYDKNTPITNDITVYAKWLTDDLEKIVYLKQIPVDLSEYDQLTRNVLSLYEVGAEVEARYVDDQAQGTGLGDKWANASDNLGQIITDITDASESKVYVVLVTGETHTPAATIGMKNHVAVIGGYDPDGSWERPPGAKTIFDGENQRRLFAATAGIDRTALFYDIEIYKGKGSVATSDSGYGMRLDTASPTLWKVIFNNNGDGVQSGSGGGLTLVEFSYPVLIDVEFRNNQVKTGGALFVKNSSIVLSNVEFNNNKSGKNLNEDGRGAMYVLIEKDHDSGKYPDMILDGVTFSANEGSQGGGLAIIGESSLDNDILPITVKNVEFEDNTSTSHGGGVYIKNLNAFFENTTFANNSGKYGGAINGNASSLVFVNTTFYNNEAEFGSVARMQNTEHAGGEAPHLKFINITAVDNNTTDENSGDVDIMADYTGTDGGSTQLINSLFWDENFNDKGVLINVNVDNKRTSSHHKLDLMSNVLENLTEIRINGGDDYVDFNNMGMMTENPILDSLKNNGGMVKTISISAQAMIDAGVYVKGVVADWLFYYSEDDSIWYRMNDLSDSSVVILPAEAERLNYTDARGFDRVGRPDIGAYEVQP